MSGVYVGRTDGKALQVSSVDVAEQILDLVGVMDPVGLDRGDYYIDAGDGRVLGESPLALSPAKDFAEGVPFVLIVDWDHEGAIPHGPFDTIGEAQVYAEDYREARGLPREATSENNDFWSEEGWYFAIRQPTKEEFKPVVSIHDLFNAVRAHPDYVFGTIFVTGDFPDGEVVWGEFGDAKHATEHIVAAGNEYIENEAVKKPYVTQTGRVLGDEDIQALAGEAERGYEIKGGSDDA